MHVQQAGRDDARDVGAFMASVCGEGFETQLGRTVAWLLRSPSDMVLLLRDDHLQGCVFIHRHRSHACIQALTLAPRGGGDLHAELLAAVLDWCARRGVMRTYAAAKPAEVVALALYQACGFKRLPHALVKGHHILLHD